MDPDGSFFADAFTCISGADSGGGYVDLIEDGANAAVNEFVLVYNVEDNWLCCSIVAGERELGIRVSSLKLWVCESSTC